MAWVALLGERPVVELAGPDARRFANGMFTNNVRDLPVGGSQASAMADDRGRLIGLMELHALADDRFLLVLEGMTAEAFAERYERYVVFDDVEIIDHGEQALLTVQGEGAAERLRGASLPVPEAGGHVAHGDGIVVARDRGGAGYDLLAPTPLLQVDADGAVHVDALRVWAGQVAFLRDIAAPALAHEHGLRDTVLHFEKGCYLGQEQIHRIEVMGKPRRALALLHLHSGGGEGDDVVHEGKKVGVVTSVVPHPQQGQVGMAVLRKPANEAGQAVLVGGHEATALPLPLAR